MTSAHDQYAKDYDIQVKTYHCYLAEVLFGLSYEYITRGESILDVGIGTGISSKLFYLAGLRVFGIDNSGEMLKACEKKGIAKELIEHDLLVFPWPYQDGMFNHVICCGVFHFMDDLDIVFNEISRLQKTGGIFAFTSMNWSDHQHEPEKYGCHTEDGMNIFSHQSIYLDSLLENNHYLKEKEIISSVGETQFRAIVARKAKA